MQKIILLLGLACLCACKPSATNETQHETETAAIPADSLTTSANATPTGVSIPYSGSWVNEVYYNAILEKKSPRQAQPLAVECFIHIPPTTAEQMRMGYSWHEIGPELRYAKQDGHEVLWEVQGDSVTKIAFQLKQIDETHLQINDQRFVKANVVHIQNLPLVLEEILFKGVYTTADGKKVEFKNTGEVTGLDAYTKYHVRADYMDAGLQIDQVGLKGTSGPPVYLGFKFKGNKLELYEIKCKTFENAENRCVDVGFGKLKYSLTKQ